MLQRCCEDAGNRDLLNLLDRLSGTWIWNLCDNVTIVFACFCQRPWCSCIVLPSRSYFHHWSSRWPDPVRHQCIDGGAQGVASWCHPQIDPTRGRTDGPNRPCHELGVGRHFIFFIFLLGWDDFSWDGNVCSGCILRMEGWYFFRLYFEGEVKWPKWLVAQVIICHQELIVFYTLQNMNI